MTKWIADIAPNASVYEAARHSLQARLTAIEHLLPLAAEHAAEDIEHVHQLRVATRRSIAALRLYRCLLSKKQTRWFRKQLRELRRAAGKARDLDVLTERHATDKSSESLCIIKRLHRRRQKAQKPIVENQQRLTRNHRYSKRVTQLLESLGEHPWKHLPFEDWARSHFRRISEKFFHADPSDLEDFTELHRFRIRGKQLRYAMELLATAFPRPYRDELYPIVEELQTKLGRINDHSVGCKRLKRWIERAKHDKKKRKRSELRKPLKRERRQLDQALREFRGWWTPEFAAALHGSFIRMTDGPDSAEPAAAKPESPRNEAG